MHCRSLVARDLSLCPSCDRWLDDPGSLGWLRQEMGKLRGPLIVLGLLCGLLMWAFYRA
jgi:hypothetical protein